YWRRKATASQGSGRRCHGRRRWCKLVRTCFSKPSANRKIRTAQRETSMNPKITPDHLGRGAVVYVRQSTVGQVIENTESQRRQYALAESARSLGFASVAVIDDDLGRSGSGLTERPGFQK